MENKTMTLSREMKFRAWDKENKEWFCASDPNSLVYYGFHLFGEVMQFQHVHPEVLSTIEVTQYTGLEDKNGVEVYEGDIVTSLAGVGEVRCKYGATYVVTWPNGSYNKAIDTWVDSGRFEGEVIGNIYENRDLSK